MKDPDPVRDYITESFDRLQTKLRLYVARLLNQRGRVIGDWGYVVSQDVEDAVQDTFFGALRSANTFDVDKGTSIETWLTKSARNNALRRKTGERTHRERFPLDALAGKGDDPLASVIDSEMQERVTGALKELPELQRDVIMYHHLHDMSFRDMEHEWPSRCPWRSNANANVFFGYEYKKGMRKLHELLGTNEN